MLLFTRMVTPNASPRTSLAFAANVTDIVNRKSDLDVGCWLASFGQPVGTLAWTARAESQAQLAASNAALAADGEYLDALDEVAAMVSTPGTDTLQNLVYASEPAESQVGSIGQITTAQANADKIVDAVAWGVEMAQYAESVTSESVMFATQLFGAMGTMSWISVVDDIGRADAAREKLAGDAGYLEKVAEAATLFIPGSGHVMQAQRII